MEGKTLSQLDQELIWHPFTQMKTAPKPIVIHRGKGSMIYDEQGKGYVDGISSWFVNLHGHAHPYIGKKIAEQAEILEHVIFAEFTHKPAIELARQLLPLLPGSFSKLFFSDNGATSVEVGLKMALQYWHNKDYNTKRKKILGLRGGYYGETFGTMSAAGKNHFNRPFWSHLFDVELIDPPIEGFEERSLHQLEAILKKTDIACFIFEPLILGIGGMITYSPKAMDSLLKQCRDQGILLIADEVLTGFGRTGRLFASETLEEKPDIICLSKGLTGGFLPLGATACREEIYQGFLSDHFSHALLHGHSYTGNPLACTSALASLELLVSEECHAQREKICHSHQQFCKKWRGHPSLKRCEFLGTILILEYGTGTTGYYNPIRDRLYSFFLKHGVLLRPLGNVLYVMPPYCIKEDELTLIYNLIEESWKSC